MKSGAATSWVSLTDGQISFSLADAAAYRTAGASKAIPGFDAIDYGQEDYVKLEGPAATKYIDDMLAAQIRYQQEPKNDGAWLKTR